MSSNNSSVEPMQALERVVGIGSGTVMEDTRVSSWNPGHWARSMYLRYLRNLRWRRYSAVRTTLEHWSRIPSRSERSWALIRGGGDPRFGSWASIPVGRLGGHGWSLERHCGMRRTSLVMETRRCVSEKVTDDLYAPSKLCHRLLHGAVSGVMPWMPRWMPCGHWGRDDDWASSLAAHCQGPYTCVTGDTAFRICCHQCTPNRKPD